MNNPNLTDEQLLKRRRTALYSVCILIFLLHAQLSIFLDKVFQYGFSSNQMDSLTGILFVALLITALRYHHAVVASDAWSDMMEKLLPYRRKALHAHNILLDRTSYGHSEHSESDWHNMETDEFYTIPYYTLEEDGFFGTSELSCTNKKNKIGKWKKRFAYINVVQANTSAWIKFSLNHSKVLDVLVPYLFFLITFVEITGIIKISAYIEDFGHILKCHKSECSTEITDFMA